MAEPTHRHRPGALTLSPKQIGAIVLGVLALVFIVQNSNQATLEFLVFSWTAPVWITFLVILLVGVAIGYFLRGARDDRKKVATKH